MDYAYISFKDKIDETNLSGRNFGRSRNIYDFLLVFLLAVIPQP